MRHRVKAILEKVAILIYQLAYKFFFTIRPKGGSLHTLVIVLRFDLLEQYYWYLSFGGGRFEFLKYLHIFLDIWSKGRLEGC